MPAEEKEKTKEKEIKAFGEKVWDSTKEFLSKVKEDADKSIKILSLKSEISRLKRDQNKLYTKLGKTAYQKISLGSLKDNELIPTADEISKLQQEIDEKGRRIEKIKDAIGAPPSEEAAPSKTTQKTTETKASKKSAKPKVKKSS